MAVKIAHDLDLFDALCETTSFVTCEELAAAKNASDILIGMILSLCFICWTYVL